MNGHLNNDGQECEKSQQQEDKSGMGVDEEGEYGWNNFYIHVNMEH
jgi:hypothetical protein